MKDKILKLLDRGMSPREVAEVVGCLDAYVRVVRARKQRKQNTGTVQLPSEIGRTKRRYHSDPDFRQKHIAGVCANIKRRRKIDPVFRAKCAALSRSWRAKKYKTDEEYRQKEQARKREYHRVRKKDPLFRERERERLRRYTKRFRAQRPAMEA